MSDEQPQEGMQVVTPASNSRGGKWKKIVLFLFVGIIVVVAIVAITIVLTKPKKEVQD